MPRRDVWMEPGYGRSPDSAWSRVARSVTLGGLLVVLAAFAFGLPLWERHMHVVALEGAKPELWGPHLAALCGIRGGRADLYAYVQQTAGVQRQHLLSALVERNCLEDMSADIQTEAYFQEEGYRVEGAARGAAPPAWLGGVLERAAAVLERSEPGDPHAVRALRVLERRWEALSEPQRRSLAFGIARQLPDPVARRLLLLDSAAFIPPLFEALAGSFSDSHAAAAALELLVPTMDPAQKLEFELWLASAGPRAGSPPPAAAPAPLTSPRLDPGLLLWQGPPTSPRQEPPPGPVIEPASAAVEAMDSAARPAEGAPEGGAPEGGAPEVPPGESPQAPTTTPGAPAAPDSLAPAPPATSALAAPGSAAPGAAAPPASAPSAAPAATAPAVAAPAVPASAPAPPAAAPPSSAPPAAPDAG